LRLKIIETSESYVPVKKPNVTDRYGLYVKRVARFVLNAKSDTLTRRFRLSNLNVKFEIIDPPSKILLLYVPFFNRFRVIEAHYSYFAVAEQHRLSEYIKLFVDSVLRVATITGTSKKNQ